MRRNTAIDYHKLADSRGFKWLGIESPSNNKAKTLWQCSKEHQWLAKYANIKTGSDCPICSNSNIPKTPDEYHELARGRGFKWLDTETRARFPVLWECSEGHQWKARFGDIKRGDGCPYCGNRIPLIEKDYITLAESRGFKWLGPMVTTKSPTEWMCEKGHTWKTYYNHILRTGTGCPTCSQSKGEERIAYILSKYNIQFDRQKRFDACRAKAHLPFDFYFQLGESYILIEYDGEQHFRPIEGWSGQEAFEQRKLYDKIKTDFALKYGFSLIRIPYTEKDIESYLVTCLNKILGVELEPIERSRYSVVLPTDNYTQLSLC